MQGLTLLICTAVLVCAVGVINGDTVCGLDRDIFAYLETNPRAAYLQCRRRGAEIRSQTRSMQTAILREATRPRPDEAFLKKLDGELKKLTAEMNTTRTMCYDMAAAVPLRMYPNPCNF